MKKLFASFPGWTFSIVWLLLLIWLMDVPTPYMEYVSDSVGDHDHLCHIFMAAVMAGCICFDWQRRHKWQFLRLTIIGVAAVAGFLLSGTLEVLQIFSPAEYRRWFDPIDLMWQAVGAAVIVPIYFFCQRLWAEGEKHR